MGVGLAGVFVALAAAASRSVRERREAAERLHALGANPRQQYVAAGMAQGLPLLVCLSLASAVAAMLWVVLDAVYPGSTTPAASYALLLALPVLITGATLAVCTPAFRVAQR